MPPPPLWTRADECQAFLQGWNVFRGLVGYERDIIRIRSNEDALAHVTSAAPHDALAKKALTIHKHTLMLKNRASQKREKRLLLPTSLS